MAAVQTTTKEDDIVNSAIHGDWLGAVLMLGTIVTLGVWTLNKLFPGTTVTHSDRIPPDRANNPGESDAQPRDSVEQHH
jgi:hypothetical protein